jgi:5-oxoprolinase (ATP-hydrolysing)
MAGGAAGKCGVNFIRKADGRTKTLGHREVLRVNQNDVIIIETPGGGGYGKPEV